MRLFSPKPRHKLTFDGGNPQPPVRILGHHHRNDRVALRGPVFETGICVPSTLPLQNGPRNVAAAGGDR